VRIPDLLRRNALAAPDRIAWQYRGIGDWHSLSRSQALSSVESVADVLRRRFPAGARIAIDLPNRIEWVIADLAIQMADAVVVAIQSGLPSTLKYRQLAHAQVSALWTAASPRLTDAFAEVPTLREIYPLGYRSSPDAFAGGIVGTSLPREDSAACDPSVATIVYTSGTTGSPKGAILSHAALIHNARTTQSALPFADDGVVLNWLPLSHIYARNSDLLQCLVSGTTLAFAESPPSAVRDIAAIRPTNMHGVPRFYESILRDYGGDRLREVFGDRIDWIKAGGATLPANIARDYHNVGMLLLQGYGATEAAPVIASSTRTAQRPGTVGRVLPGTEWTIDPTTRELSIRSESLFSGYWRDPERTAGVLVDGWLKTGDLAEVSEDGFLTIRGRACETIVLSTGKKLQPEAIESLLADIAGLEDAFVCGTGKPWPVALLWAADDRERIEAEVRARCAGLPTWEQIRRIAWFDGPPSALDGERTASGKWRRENVQSRYRQRIDRLYE